MAAFAVCVIAAAWFSVQPWTETSALLVVVGFVVAAPLVYRIASGSFDPFEPVIVFAAGWAVMFLIHPAAMYLDDSEVYVSPTRTLGLHGTFNEMLALGMIGALAFYAGYALPVGRAIAGRAWIPRTRESSRALEVSAITFGVLGVALFFLFLHSTGGAVGVLTLLHGRSSTLYAYVTGSTGYFWLGPYLLIPAAFVLLAYGRATGQRSVWVIGGLFGAILTIRGYALGDRLILTPFWGGIVVYYFVSRGKRPGAIALLGTLVGALLVITVVGAFRTASVRATTSAGSAALSIVSHPTMLLATLTSTHDSGEAAALAAALTVVPSQISYEHGAATVGDLIQRPVPRLLWPNKPLKPKFQVIRLLWPREYAAHIANPEFSCLLVFYMDFGVLGVILGMIGYGILARVVWAYFVLHSTDMFARLMLALMVPFVVMEIRDSFTDSFIRAMLIFFPVWAIFYLSQHYAPLRARSVGTDVHGGVPATAEAAQGL